ncbi:chemotaxis protein CheX [Nocardioides sp. GY 10127]|uniref:chemotaxis protein CheX n=1 Tax=Nocardioides sp. GY 10127 TaxID=2569762 RepID=UPI0010A82F22|nr:chemotaxis protein CheX [Nocardioides sp. GY 10127]TIC78623.1 chemotaxis protein CheX [Nocardioides sp. GY 10127]
MTVVAEPALGDLHTVVEEVWSTFLADGNPILPADGPSEDVHWTAAITVTGAWEAQISVVLSEAAATGVGATMLAIDEATCSTADVRDALGELVNIVGGNVKSLMPGPSVLSLPLVGHGDIAPTSDLQPVRRLDLLWRGEPVVVVVHVPVQDSSTTATTT